MTTQNIYLLVDKKIESMLKSSMVFNTSNLAAAYAKKMQIKDYAIAERLLLISF